MRSHLRIYRLLPLLLMLALLAGTVANAQDATVQPTPEITPVTTIEGAAGEDGTGADAVVSEPIAGAGESSGVSTTGLALGVLLLGLGAVAAVGGLNWLRDSYRRPTENE